MTNYEQITLNSLVYTPFNTITLKELLIAVEDILRTEYETKATHELLSMFPPTDPCNKIRKVNGYNCYIVAYMKSNSGIFPPLGSYARLPRDIVRNFIVQADYWSLGHGLMEETDTFIKDQLKGRFPAAWASLAIEFLGSKRWEPSKTPSFVVPYIYNELFQLTLAIVSLSLPAYVILWITDFIPSFNGLKEVVKINLIQRVTSFYRSKNSNKR